MIFRVLNAPLVLAPLVFCHMDCEKIRIYEVTCYFIMFYDLPIIKAKAMRA